MQNQFDFRRGAINPIQCLSDGFELLKGNYWMCLALFALGSLIMAVTICMPIFFPPIICGFYMCLFAIMRREAISTGKLFEGFKFIGHSLIAYMIFSVLLFVFTVITQFVVNGISETVKNLKPENYPSDESIYILPLLGIPFSFIYPLIVDRKLGGFQAVKLSVRAVFGNFFGVIGLTILGCLILAAGSILFCIGALFVAPFVYAAWAVAYGRVFNIQIPQNDEQINAPQNSVISPPVSNSKAGWILSLVAVLIVGIFTLAIVFSPYRATENEVDEKDMPTVTYPSTTPE